MSATKMASKSMPLMPDLDVNFNPDEEEEEDAAEEKNLMTILLKLKTAKSSLHASRKRYHDVSRGASSYLVSNLIRSTQTCLGNNFSRTLTMRTQLQRRKTKKRFKNLRNGGPQKLIRL
jgi:hypothetical protein